jgi:hypothetical protein
MRPDERLQRYLERQLALLAIYGELQGKIEESVRAGEADLLAVQAVRARELASELTALERAARPLAACADGTRLRELQALLAEKREAALRAGGRTREALADSLRELAGRIRDLAARPRTPLSPFSRIGRPTLVDIRS